MEKSSKLNTRKLNKRNKGLNFIAKKQKKSKFMIIFRNSDNNYSF